MGTLTAVGAPAAPAVLAAGRGLARSGPEPAPADDRGGPRSRRAHREHPGRLRPRRRWRCPSSTSSGSWPARWRSSSTCRGTRVFVAVTKRERYVEAMALLNGSRSLAYVAGPTIGGLLVQVLGAPLAMLGRRALVPRVGRLPAPDQVARTAGRARGGLASANGSLAGLVVRPPRPDHAPDAARRRDVNLFNFAFARAVHPVRDDDPRRLAGRARAGARGRARSAAVIGAVVASRIGRRIGLGPAYALGCSSSRSRCCSSRWPTPDMPMALILGLLLALGVRRRVSA